VEFAIVATIVFMVIFGLIEFARLSILRHAVDNAAYEAARVGIVPGATTTEVNNAADWVLANSGVSPTQISVTPFPLNDDSESITVSVAVVWRKTAGFRLYTLVAGRWSAKPRLVPNAIVGSIQTAISCMIATGDFGCFGDLASLSSAKTIKFPTGLRRFSISLADLKN